MLPFVYTARIKRPKERYILHGIIGYDFVVGLLAYSLGSPRPAWTAVCLGIYLMAFFSVYEVGYFENDKVAASREKKPVVSEEYYQSGGDFSPWMAWIFGITLAGAGAAVQTVTSVGRGVSAGAPDWTTFAWTWLLALLLLAGTRLIFLWFNNCSSSKRFLPMLLLQLARTLGYALLLPLTLAGALLCISHAWGRWMPYAVYRCDGQRAKLPAHLATLLIFVCFGGSFAVFGGGAREILESQTLAILVYLVARATIEFVRLPELASSDRKAL